jgi:outer membrane receptor for ferrienterochelin and colicin
MRRSVWILALGALATAWTLLSADRLAAQGVTTAAVTGTVTDPNGAPLAGFQVTVTHNATGAVAGVVTRGDGRYYLPGLQPGGPYTIRVEGLGYSPEVREGVTLALSQTARFDFVLRQQAIALEGIDVTAERGTVISKGRTGAATVVGQETVEKTPTLSRDFTALTRLAPQISVDGNASNAGGRNSKFNNIQIDGAANNDLFGLGSGGTPGNDVGAKPISMEAIQEFQVVIAPFDVRQGGFTGAGVNAITKSGTNEFHGSFTYFGRNQDFAGKYINFDGNEAAALGDFTDQGFAFSLGGPIMKDKLHFFVAGEFSDRSAPNGGVAIGRDASITFDEVQPIVDYVRQTYGYDAGTIGEVTMKRFSDNLFGRIDYQINQNHRLTVRHNWVDAGDDNLSRTNANYFLGNAGYEKTSKTHSTVAQLNSSFGGRYFNELRIGRTTIDDVRKVGDLFPFVTINLPNGRAISLGTENFSGKNVLEQDVIEVTNDLTFTAGRHTVTIGTHNEFFGFSNLFVRNAYGNYQFSSFENFMLGRPSRYEYSYLLPGGKDRAEFDVRQYSFYIQDQFDVTDRLTVTAGLRYDVSTFPDKPSHNPMVLDSLGRRTDGVPTSMGSFNPRIGFNWDVMGDRSTQVRGGIGYFSGRTPYVWISNAYGNTGVDYASFTCSGSAVPDFVADPHNQPTSCAGSTSLAPGVINLTNPDFEFPQVLRTSLAVDRELPYGFVGTLEWIYTKSVQDALFQELTVGPQDGIVEGRPHYRRATRGFSSVTDITNTDENYSYSITAQLQRQFAGKWDASVAYTYGEAWDVTSTTSSQAYSNWRYNPVDADPNNPKLRPSNFDVRHRIVAQGSYQLELLRNAPTNISLVYVGESGRPYSYTYANTDINGDGSRDNDLIFVPADPSQIRFQGTPEQQQASWQALNAFIEKEECLREARGKVLERNACRLPWTNQFDVRVSQWLPVPRMAGHRVELNLDVINVANLLNEDWGKVQYVPNQNSTLLRAADTTPDAQGRVLFESFSGRSSIYNISDLSSRWQIQLGARYVF